MASDILTKQITEQKKKIQQTPNDAKLHHQLGILYLQLQDLPKAQQSLENALALEPENICVMNDLSIIVDMQGKTEQAKTLLQNIIKMAPQYLEAYANLGKLHTSCEEFAEAEACLMKVLELEPKHVATINNMAAVFMQTNRHLKALEYINKALKLNPNDLMVLFNHAKLLRHFHELKKAKSVFKKLLKQQPNNPEILAEYADLKYSIGQEKNALELVNKALALDPNNYYANYYYTMMLYNYNKYEKAENYCKKALSIKNNSLQLMGILANIQLSLALFQDFEQTKKEALELVRSTNIYEKTNPFLGQLLFDNVEIQHKISRQWAKVFKNRIKTSSFARKNYHHKKLRIGYISADFGNHPIGLMVENLFQLHNRKHFEIYGFPTKKHMCPRYENICKQFDTCKFLDLSNPIQAAKTINNFEIDILIDLVGPTANDNYDILALQPASLQCHILGFTGTMGADFVQYFFTTKTIVPTKMQSAFSETVVYLPHTEIAVPGFDIPTNKLNPADHNLPKDHFIFLAHHSAYRINQEVVAYWMQILKAVPNSILWLRYSHAISKKNVLRLAIEYDISAERIVFYEGSKLTDVWQHRLADLFLDTFSHTSGTVSLFCAWAGLPMLTLLGDNPQSRVCASFCRAANVPEQIAFSKKEYIERAIYFAQNKDKLQAIKQKLLINKTSAKLFDTKLYVKHLEAAFDLIWEDFCNGGSAKEIIVPELT